MPRIKRDLKPDPASFKGDDRPVEDVSWYESVEFCDRLSAYSGRPYRLPNEAEWEYACRAGTTTPFHFGETLAADLANCDHGLTGAWRRETTPVGHFQVANSFGLGDMHGNVFEWGQDELPVSYEGASTFYISGLTRTSEWLQNHLPDSFEGPLTESMMMDLTSAFIRFAGLTEHETNRVIRGGSWADSLRHCRSAYRNCFPPDRTCDVIGFRVVCSFPST